MCRPGQRRGHLALQTSASFTPAPAPRTPVPPGSQRLGKPGCPPGCRCLPRSPSLCSPGTALSGTQVWASGERVAGIWAGVRLGPGMGPWVAWSWPSSHLGQTGQEWRPPPATGQRPEWPQPAGRLFRPTSPSGSAAYAAAWRGRRPPQGRRARPPPGRWTSGPPTHPPACTWHCWAK